jgi:alkyl sulfatase BDS1-like metallo-beta-lactamase superfamily hydrolase
MGGADAIIAKARVDFAAGEFRWVAEVMNRVVFAAPDNQEARALCADAFEQLGYLSEASTWRNAYLFGAHELRHGVVRSTWNPVAGDMVSALSTGMFFESLGVRLNGPKADGKRAIINWTFTDEGQSYVLNLENSALTYVMGRLADNADASLTLERATLTKILQRQKTFPEAIGAGEIKMAGNPGKLLELFGLFDEFDSCFAIVEP